MLDLTDVSGFLKARCHLGSCSSVIANDVFFFKDVGIALSLPLAFFTARMCCCLMFNLVSTSSLRSFSAMLLSS